MSAIWGSTLSLFWNPGFRGKAEPGGWTFAVESGKALVEASQHFRSNDLMGHVTLIGLDLTPHFIDHDETQVKLVVGSALAFVPFGARGWV
jgi:hypothetical protein